MFARLALVLALWIAGPALAMAAMELQAPDGRTVVLYDDNTWEYKRPAPVLAADTVVADELIADPSKFAGKALVVNGTLVNLLGEYRLQSSSGQKAMTVDVSKIRRADQIALENALKKAGTFGSVKVQVHGKVEQGMVAYKLAASELLLL